MGGFLAAIAIVLFPASIIYLIINVIKKREKKKPFILLGVSVVMFIIAGFIIPPSSDNKVEKSTEPTKAIEITEDNTIKETDPTEVVNTGEETKKETDIEKVPTEYVSSFKKESEKNSNEHPATAGKVLVTKGKHKFTGMKYYFKGQLKAIGSAEAFNNKNVWLIKNDSGYVMPVEMFDGETANIDDVVEIWGTLSGEGYSLPNIDNVVGETGYLIMNQYSINGEPII